MEIVFAKDVADILAEETLNALPKLLDVVNVLLFHPPCTVFGVRWTWREGFHLLFDFIVPGYVCNEVFDERECTHRFDRDGFVERYVVETCHAHQFRLPVDFCRARAAFPRFTVPSDCHVVRLFGLDTVDSV